MTAHLWQLDIRAVDLSFEHLKLYYDCVIKKRTFVNIMSDNFRDLTALPLEITKSLPTIF